MRFGILGPLVVADDQGRELALGGHKQRAVLAILLLHAGEEVTTDRLIDELWGERAPATAAKTIQVYVSNLRKALGNGVVVTGASGYVLKTDPAAIDANRFQGLVAKGRQALQAGEARKAAARLSEALQLWRGQALADFAYESFAQTELMRLAEARQAALEDRIDADLANGDHGALVGELESLVREYPLRERLWAQLMLALYRSGRQADALEGYQRARVHLAEELGLEPGPALRAIQMRILEQNASLDLRRPSAREIETAQAHDADAAAQEPAAPRQERKVVTVVVAELVDVVERSGRTDAEDVLGLLAPYQERLGRQIERFGGTVQSFVGEEMIALFGAPVAHEDDPERAVRAALAIRDWAARPGEPQVRIAVDTQEALITIGADDERRAAMGAGAAVSRTARLRSAAPVGGILVGERAYRATRGCIEYRQTAQDASRSSMPAWEALQAHLHRGVDLVRTSRAALVGRARELDLLESVLARAVEERAPQLVTLVGVPGIGKSRLMLELAARVRRDRERIAWLQGRCLSYGDGVSFWALGEIIKAHAGILESDSPEQTSEKLRAAIAMVLTDEEEARWVEGQLRLLVGARSEPTAPPRPGPSFAAWRRFLAGLAEEKPLVLVVEDVQWADNGLLDFIDELTVRLRDAPLLVVCTARPELVERRPGWGGGKANALTISLSPLSDAETAQLVTLIERPPLSAGALRALLARAGGIPLFAEQLARVEVEVGPIGELPDTVQGIIGARLDGLPAEEKALLEDAAVIGEIFWDGAIAAVGDVSRERVGSLLAELERKEFVYRARRGSVAGEAEYAFQHILLKDVAYELIPRARRGDKHRRAAAWIESLGRGEDHAEMLGHHYWRALEYTTSAERDEAALVERARVALRAAGDRALALASYTSAARFYTAALKLWPESDPDRVRLLADSGRARHGADQTGTDLLEQAFEQLQARGEVESAAEVAVELARFVWIGGDRDRAYAHIDRALELTSRRGRSRARAYALVERAAFHMSANEYTQAIRLACEALPLTEDLAIDELRARALDVLGGSRTGLGDPGGLEDSKQAIAIARTCHAFSRLVIAELNQYSNYFSLGQLAAASDALRSARRDAEGYGTADQRKWSRVQEAQQGVLHGRWEEATEILTELIAESDAGPARYYLDPAAHGLRASIELAYGELEAAAADSERALHQARRAKDPQLLAPALAIQAMVQLAHGHGRQATQLATEILCCGSTLVSALAEVFTAPTLIEFAWLLRDLHRENELLPALTSAPPTPWMQAAKAIAGGNLDYGLELVTAIGAPSIEAYTRLRTAEAMVAAGRPREAGPHLTAAAAFFRQVRAKRYLAQAEKILAAAAA